MATNYDRERLWNKLPNAPKATNKSLATSVVYGITHKEGHKLVNVARIGGDYVKVPNSGVDLMRTNAAKELRVKCSDANRGFMESLNRSMAGGEDYPLLTGLLSIGAGLFSAGAGILFTIASSAVSAAKSTQPTRARIGDEVWSLEVVTRGPTEGGSSTFLHIQYYLLVDPFRQGNHQIPSEWVIFEERTRLVI
jgi:hypothetical protein